VFLFALDPLSILSSLILCVCALFVLRHGCLGILFPDFLNLVLESPRRLVCGSLVSIRLISLVEAIGDLQKRLALLGKALQGTTGIDVYFKIRTCVYIYIFCWV
jgi:hypothetical protein